MERHFPVNLHNRWDDPRGLIQIFMGPRQVGKTTAALTLSNKGETVLFTADSPTPPPASAIAEAWAEARALSTPRRTLILDEVQKVPGWSEVVKRLWDEDQRTQMPLRVGLLGSSALLIEKGLSEGLTGRFEINYFPHWVYSEVRRLKRVDLVTYMRFGGYPKVYDLIDDESRAQEYIENSIIEPTLGRDILSLHAVDKPALLRQLFWYVSRLPAHIVSFEKILGHLQDRGNSATLSHYAHLLKLAFFVVPIFKYSHTPHRTKKSIPKWILPNPALVDRNLVNEAHHASQRSDWGFIVENAVGAHVLNVLYGSRRYELMYWRDRNREIDFIVTDRNTPVLAIEVKSGHKDRSGASQALQAAGIKCRLIVVSDTNIQQFLEALTIEDMLSLAPNHPDDS